MIRTFIVTIAAFGALTPAIAGVTANQIIEKEIVIAGDDGVPMIKRTKADKVAPGEEVIYTLRFQNESDEVAEAVVLVMPVPKEISYVEGTVSGSDTKVAFSADDGVTYMPRGRLTVNEGGSERPAKSDEITHIRWTLDADLAPNEQREVSYRGILR